MQLAMPDFTFVSRGRMALLACVALFSLCCRAIGGELIEDAVWYDSGSAAWEVWRNTLGSVERATEYLKANPRCGVADDVLLELAGAQARRGKVEEAIRLLDQLIRDYPDNKKLYMGYLNRAEKPHESPAVIAQYRAALLTFPARTSDLARVAKAECLETLGKAEEARAIYERIARECWSAERMEANRTWVAHLVLGYEDPLDEALAALVRLDLAAGRVASASLRARLLAEFYPGSDKSLAAIDAFLELAFRTTGVVDDPYWTELRSRTVKRALMVASRPEARNPDVCRRMGEALHAAAEGIRRRWLKHKGGP